MNGALGAPFICAPKRGVGNQEEEEGGDGESPSRFWSRGAPTPVSFKTRLRRRKTLSRQEFRLYFRNSEGRYDAMRSTTRSPDIQVKSGRL